MTDTQAATPVSVVLLRPDSLAGLDDAPARWSEAFAALNRPHEIILGDLPEPMTVGDQLREGISRAQFPLVLTTISDHQPQPEELQRMFEEIDREVEISTGKAKADLVTGYRVSGSLPTWLGLLDLGKRLFMRVIFGMSLPRRESWLGWRGWTTRWIARWIFGVAVQDPACPFRLYRRELFRRIAIQSNSQFVHVELIAKANFLGALIAEIPVAWTPVETSEPSRKKGEVLRLFTKPDFGPPFLGA